MTSLRNAFLAATALVLVAGGARAADIVKSPDLGDYWSPLSNDGTFVYANSFIAPVSGLVSDLGIWLNGGSSEFKLQVVAGLGAGGPDSQTVLATTGVQSGAFGVLTYVHFAPISSLSLVSGMTYWFQATAVGLGGSGSYNVGGHTQNSDGITDNGTFWYSNDPAGISFDGRSLNPEMAFTVTLSESSSPIPEPASMALLGAGLLGLGFARRRSR